MPRFARSSVTAEASAYNRNAYPGRKVKAYEIQVWTWVFRSNSVHIAMSLCLIAALPTPDIVARAAT
jgi:hypothetical protein